MAKLDLGILQLDVKSRTPISFYTSPYPSHVMGAALDLGKRQYEDDDTFHIPFSGRFLSAEKFAIARPSRGSKTKYDYLVSVEILGSRKIVKILHVEPEIDVGVEFGSGDFFGRFIRSPYLASYHFLHAHIEVHDRRSRLNPTAAQQFKISGKTVLRKKGVLGGEVVCREENYILLKSSTHGQLNLLNGVPGEANGEYGLLNAEFPCSCYGGLLGVEVKRRIPVEVDGLNIGECARTLGNVTLFELKKGIVGRWIDYSSLNVLKNQNLKCRGLNLTVGNMPLYGIEFVLVVDAGPVLKLLAVEGKSLPDVKEGDFLSVKAVD